MTTLDHFFQNQILCKKSLNPFFFGQKKTLANAGASLLAGVKWHVHIIL